MSEYPPANDTPLDSYRSNEKIVPNSGIPILFQERHEKTEPDKDHDVDILVNWVGHIS